MGSARRTKSFEVEQARRDSELAGKARLDATGVGLGYETSAKAPPNVLGKTLINTTWKLPVRAATTTDSALATTFENTDMIDGVTLATGDRILIKNQTTGSENGIYTVNATGTPSRASDFDDGFDSIAGVSIIVEEGTTNADTFWFLSTNNPITLDTTSLTFTEITGTGSGVTFPLNPDINARGNVTGTVTVDLSLTTAHYQEMTLIGNITFVFSNPPADNKEISFILDILQDATGGRTVTWPASVRVDPTVGSGVNDRTVVVVTTVDNGTNFDALIVTGGTINAATKELDNLGTTSINTDLLFANANLDIGSSTTPLDGLFAKRIIPEIGTINAGETMITEATGPIMVLNVATGGKFDFRVNNVAIFDIDSGNMSGNNIILSNVLTLNDNTADPSSNGEFARNMADVKVFSGDAVRNLSDITTAGLPVVDTTSIAEGSVDATKEVRFEVDGNTTGIIGVIATQFTTAKTVTIPDVTADFVMTSGNQSIGGNKTFSLDILASGSPNIGSSGSKFAAIFLTNVRFDASTQFITANAAEMRFALPTADVFNWEINLVDELTLSATALNVHGNDITNVGEIVSTSGNVDVGDATTGFDAFFGRRIEFPNVLGVAVAANRQIISTTVSTINTIRMNLPLDEDFIITENGVTAPIAFHLDTSAGTLTLDNPILSLRINQSSLLTITKSEGGPAAFTTNDTFTFNDDVIITGAVDVDTITNSVAISVTTDLDFATGSTVDFPQTGSASSGAGGTLPANVESFIVVKVAGVSRRIPFYPV